MSPKQSFADLGVTGPVVDALKPVAASPPPSRSRTSSSRTSSTAATCSPSRRPARARRSPSACRWSSASSPTTRRPPRSSSPRRASSRRRSSPRSSRSPPPATCASPRSTAASASTSRPSAQARAHILVATPGRLEDLLQRRAVRPGRDPHARPRRGRPHARHGLQARRRPDRPPVPDRPPDAVLLRHARGRGRPARRRLHRRSPSRARTARRRKRAGDIEHRFYAVEREERVDALSSELVRGQERDLALVFVRTKRRRRPARQAPRSSRA